LSVRTAVLSFSDRVPRTPVLLATLALLVGGCGGSDPGVQPPTLTTPFAAVSPSPAPLAPIEAPAEFAALEKQFDARVGVYALDTGSGKSLVHRPDTRFAFCSTIKVFSTAALLASGADLDTVVTYRKGDLVTYSPITSKHVDDGMSLRAVADAAIRYSDNTAANLLLDQVGGLSALGRALRSVGDATTHVDRTEPELNSAVPGDVRDTSTPRALATDLRTYVLGPTLDADDRALLTDLLRRNTTGDTLIRAGVPKGWVVGDKTGSGSYGTRNDIAVLWPPNRAPIVLAVLTSRKTPDAAKDDALVARAAELALARLG
jgi:beta-lactamase class A